MMKKEMILLIFVLATLALSACGNPAEPIASEEPAGMANTFQTTVLENAYLSAEYAGALSVQGQLALGTLQLEDTELAVDKTLAAELLLLWQALQSLSNSDTTAVVEIDAVVNQIQESMTAEQIAAIAAMQLTEESLTAMMENGELSFGQGNTGASDAEATPVGGDGFPEGGFPGGGPGNGEGFPGGLPGGGGFGDLSADDIATRQAQFAEGGFGNFQDRMLTGAVIRFLQVKTGVVPELDAGQLTADGLSQ